MSCIFGLNRVGWDGMKERTIRSTEDRDGKDIKQMCSCITLDSSSNKAGKEGGSFHLHGRKSSRG